MRIFVTTIRWTRISYIYISYCVLLNLPELNDLFLFNLSYSADISAHKSQKTTTISQSNYLIHSCGLSKKCNFSIQDGQAAFSRKTRLHFVLSQKPSTLSNPDLEDRQESLKSSLIRKWKNPFAELLDLWLASLVDSEVFPHLSSAVMIYRLHVGWPRCCRKADEEESKWCCHCKHH